MLFEQLTKWIVQIVGYIVVVSFFRKLVSNLTYLKYMRVCTGFLLLTMLLHPFLHRTNIKNEWFSEFEEQKAFLQQELRSIELNELFSSYDMEGMSIRIPKIPKINVEEIVVGTDKGNDL